MFECELESVHNLSFHSGAEGSISGPTRSVSTANGISIGSAVFERLTHRDIDARARAHTHTHTQIERRRDGGEVAVCHYRLVLYWVL